MTHPPTSAILYYGARPSNAPAIAHLLPSPPNKRLKLSKPNRDARPGVAIDRLRSLAAVRWLARAVRTPGHSAIRHWLSEPTRSPTVSRAMLRRTPGHSAIRHWMSEPTRSPTVSRAMLRTSKHLLSFTARPDDYSDHRRLLPRRSTLMPSIPCDSRNIAQCRTTSPPLEPTNSGWR